MSENELLSASLRAYRAIKTTLERGNLVLRDDDVTALRVALLQLRTALLDLDLVVDAPRRIDDGRPS